MLFHGTRRKCRVGNDHEGVLEPCYDRECSLCCILRESFRVKRAGPRAMFGRGIYTTDISSSKDLLLTYLSALSALSALITYNIYLT